MTAKALINGNDWERALYRDLVSQEDGQRERLDAYRSAIGASESAAFTYLVSIIAGDIRRHQATFAALAETLQTEVDHGTGAFAVPRLGHWGFEGTRLEQMADRLLADETKEAARLEDLEAALEPVRSTTMWRLLISLIGADVGKHVEILTFVKDQIARDTGSQPADWSGIGRSESPEFKIVDGSEVDLEVWTHCST